MEVIRDPSQIENMQGQMLLALAKTLGTEQTPGQVDSTLPALINPMAADTECVEMIQRQRRSYLLSPHPAKVMGFIFLSVELPVAGLH